MDPNYQDSNQNLNQDLLKKEVLQINQEQKSGKIELISKKAEEIRGIFFAQTDTNKSSLKEMMLKSPYWNYVYNCYSGQYREYFGRVLKEAEKLIKSTDIEEYAPIKIPQKKDDGGGAPPAMGRSKTLREIFAKNKTSPGMFYLRRDEKEDYGIKNSFIDKVFKGEFPLYDKTGFCFTYEVGGESESSDILAPRRGALAKILPYVNHHLPYAIKESLSKSFKDLGIKDYHQLAVKLFSKTFNEGGAIDINNIICRIKSPSYAILFNSEKTSIKEPEEIQKIRISLGETIHPFLENIEQSARIDGIILKKEIELDHIKSESFKKWQTDTYKKVNQTHLDKNKETRILSTDEVEISFSVPSLIMTAINLCSSENKVADSEKILIQICRIMTMPCQEIYKTRPVSVEEASRISRIESFRWFEKVVEAYSGDDSVFLLASTWAKETKNPFLITTLAKLAVCQNRLDVIHSDPDLAIGDNYICASMTSHLDVSDSYVEKLVLKYFSTYPEILIGKIMELAYLGNSTALFLLEDNPLVASLIIERKEINKENSGKIIKIINESESEFEKYCAFVALIKNYQDEKTISKITISPSELECFDFEAANKYKKITRTLHNGVKIPKAHELYSLKENEDLLSLSKHLYSIEDAPALLVLCHLVSSRFTGESETEKYVLGYIISALKVLGYIEEVKSVLTLNKVKFDDSGIRKITLPNPLEEISLNHIKDCLDSGDIINAANLINSLYLKREDDAIDILSQVEQNEILSKLLSDEIRQDKRCPSWAKNKRVKAAIFNDGTVLIR